nr:MAG TPA_asm: cysteine-rich protein [Caudoviricetes sp.]
MLTVKRGWLICPTCPRTQFILHLLPDTEAKNLQVYCRRCKTVIKVNIRDGQCFESPS